MMDQKGRVGLLPLVALLFLVLGISISPVAIIGDEGYTLYEIYVYSEKIEVSGERTEGLMDTLQDITLFMIISLLLAVLFGILSLKLEMNVIVAALFSFLGGLSILAYFAVISQLVKQMGQLQIHLSYSPFILLISAFIFLLQYYRNKKGKQVPEIGD